eukprot:TRINITY_DN2880_c0_g1_i1.p1 TRINITY_DN2880_c0_g1~~TRINITY_DN2880_c0_g1_i1.p1  ORF type:complete len:209 (+),score=53.87 TRINITY_DN2880_c0_g1_i1:39-665(+)
MMSAPPGYLWFYETRGRYGCFSNFSRHPIYIEGVKWPTSEHYFQAMKFAPHSARDVEAVRYADSPAKAARMGRDRQRPLRRDWEAVKDDVMRVALRAKFMQHEDCKEILLATRGLYLVEHTVNDAYWGDGGYPDWSVERKGENFGKNMLGTLLTELRDDLLAGHASSSADDAADGQPAPEASCSAASPGGGPPSEPPAKKKKKERVQK